MEDAHAGMTFFLKIVARTFGLRFSAQIFVRGILGTKFVKFIFFLKIKIDLDTQLDC